MATIELKKVEKKFGDNHAVQPMDLTIHDGEFVVLLGPSGCGKTTTLRMIAGLETVTGGRVLLDGKDVTNAQASERDIAFVFQFFALYPHLTARENIAFPLQAQGAGRAEVKQRVDEVIKLLEIEHLQKRRPGALSGGDRQRVALARALVRRPAAFLMDEPLGALDADFRESMRAEIKKLHLRLNATTVYVTHDQVEAMAMGDRIVVMSAAVIQQIGTPSQVYHDPTNVFVARFIGSPGMNLMPAEYRDGVAILAGGNRFPVPDAWRKVLDARDRNAKILVGFRPEAAILGEKGPIEGKVYGDDMHGAYLMMNLTIEDGGEVYHCRAQREMAKPIGTKVRFDIKPEMVRFFDAASGDAIQMEVSRG